MRRWAAAGIALSLLAGGGCAVLGAGGDQCGFPASASNAFPTTTLEDWVTYGDHAVVLSGTDELEQYGRSVVRLKTERTLWSRDRAAVDAPQETFAPTRRSWNAAAAESGHQYLLIGAWWDAQQNGNPEWVHLELLAFDDGVVGRGSAGCPPDETDSGRTAAWDRSETEVADLLRRTPPDPAAVPFMALDPADRWQKVAAEG
jgi:hypothetical protein